MRPTSGQYFVCFVLNFAKATPLACQELTIANKWKLARLRQTSDSAFDFRFVAQLELDLDLDRQTLLADWFLVMSTEIQKGVLAEEEGKKNNNNKEGKQGGTEDKEDALNFAGGSSNVARCVVNKIHQTKFFIFIVLLSSISQSV